MLFLRYRWFPRRITPHFIVCTERTGSNLLLSYLNSVPGLSFAGEILHPDQVHGIPSTNTSKEAVIRHIRYSLNQCRHERGGVKLRADQLKAHDLDVRQLREHFPSCKVIILYRRSLADHYLSRQIALATGQWIARGGEKGARLNGKIRIDRDDFVKHCGEVQEFYARTLGSEGVRSYAVVLSYEELVANTREVFGRKLFPFLGVTPAEVATDLVRQRTSHPRDVVENYESVRDLWEDPRFRLDYE